ncbi:hypothetical protein BD410DRAFT_542862 [Rickenella mellea]|uniref:Uncharacterized protein n=1 Tax=Rickenella mellea TaxID=50990 RepID=A0A4Y7PQE2_9AGAM|nr:hypothetical protein BD410DRAFT_542862 [Rickenella mellea]
MSIQHCSAPKPPIHESTTLHAGSEFSHANNDMNSALDAPLLNLVILNVLLALHGSVILLQIEKNGNFKFLVVDLPAAALRWPAYVTDR